MRWPDWLPIRVVAALWFIATAASAHASTGMASFYGGGERLNAHTASGERFRPGALTAAHWTLPLGARVRVTNLGNGKSVVVRINDRGPHPRLRREIDLSKGAFSRIASVGSGLIRVSVVVL